MSNALPPHVPRPLPIWLRVLIWIVVLGLLAAVFALYLQPDMARTVADQIWACF